MFELQTDEKIKAASPNIAMGYIKGKVKVEKSCDELIKIMKELEEKIIETMKLEDITKEKNIIAGRELYKALGKSPSKYRTSSEALLRRILQGKGLYFVNNVVDINNILSIRTCCSCGSYDLDKVTMPLYFSVGKEGENYKGIGKDIINIENLPVFKDEKGCFGSPTSDSERAMITEQTKNFVMFVMSFGGAEGIEEELNYGKILLEKFADGKDLEVNIIK